MSLNSLARTTRCPLHHETQQCLCAQVTFQRSLTLKKTSQEGEEEVRYTPVPEGIIGDAAVEGATRRIQDVALELALRSAATLHTFVQVRAFGTLP